MMRHEFRLLLVAVQFLTRIPVPALRNFETEWLDRSAKYFPVVGLLVGGFSAAVLWMASAVWPQPIPALLAVLAGIAVTGAFHEDGLADTADGLGGGLTRERRLEIMKDSRIGTYGSVALGGALALKTTALAAMPVDAAALALLAAHATARLAPLAMIRLAPYAGDADAAKVKPLATGIGAGELGFAAAVGFGTPLACLGPAAGLIATCAAALAAVAVARQAWRLIGGYTGDILGAMEQAAEVVFLLAAAALAVR